MFGVVFLLSNAINWHSLVGCDGTRFKKNDKVHVEQLELNQRIVVPRDQNVQLRDVRVNVLHPLLFISGSCWPEEVIVKFFSKTDLKNNRTNKIKKNMKEGKPKVKSRLSRTSSL